MHDGVQTSFDHRLIESITGRHGQLIYSVCYTRLGEYPEAVEDAVTDTVVALVRYIQRTAARSDEYWCSRKLAMKVAHTTATKWYWKLTRERQLAREGTYSPRLRAGATEIRVVHVRDVVRHAAGAVQRYPHPGAGPPVRGFGGLRDEEVALLLDRLHQLMAELDELDQRLIELKYTRDLPWADIAEMLEIRCDRARKRASRAMKRLGTELQSELKRFRSTDVNDNGQ